MYAVSYEVMFMPTVHWCNTIEEAEAMKKKVEQKFPTAKVTITKE